MDHLQTHAQQLIEQGFSITPVVNKIPQIKNWQKIYGDEILSPQNKSYWRNANGIGILCGKPSGVICLDIDIRKDNEKLSGVLEKLEKLLPPIFCGRLGDISKPAARFFSYTGEMNEKFNNISVEILSTGNQVVIPPSLHPSGVLYSWVNHSLADIDPDELPVLSEDVLVFLREENNLRKKTKTGSILQPMVGRCKSGSHNYLSSMGVAMRHKGKTTQEMVQRLLIEDQKINKGEPRLYFTCPSRKEWKSADPVENAQFFVAQIEKNHLPDLKEEELYPNKDNGFFKVIEKVDAKGNVTNKEIAEYYELANYLKNELKMKNTDSMIYYYKDEFYRSITRGELVNIISTLTLEKAQAGQIKSFYEIIRAVTFDKSISNPEINKGFINLKNGVLDIQNKKLLPHTHEMFFKYKLPHEYDPQAQCPNWIDFLNRIFKGDKELVDLSAEIFGYALSGDDPWLHKCFLLYGQGRNGKSAYIEVLQKLLGEDNVCSIPMENLSKPFSVVMGDGKLANIVGELSNKDMDSSSFKTAVGGEYLIAAQKGMAEYRTRFMAKMFFACNSLPKFRDQTSGLWEKLCIIPFDYYLKPNERIPQFAEKFLFSEISGVLNWAIDGYRRLVEREHLPEIKALEEVIMEYRMEANSVLEWSQQNLVLGIKAIADLKLPLSNFPFQSKEPIGAKELYSYYVEFCTKNNLFPCKQLTFSRRLNSIVLEKYNELEGNDFTFFTYKRVPKFGPIMVLK